LARRTDMLAGATTVPMDLSTYEKAT